jgi:hypothetical protein
MKLVREYIKIFTCVYKQNMECTENLTWNYKYTKMVFLNHQFICNQKQSHFVSKVRETYERRMSCKFVRSAGLLDIMQPIPRNSGAWLQLYKAKPIHIILVLTFTLHFHLCIRISSHIRSWLISAKQLLQCSMLRQAVHTVTTAMCLKMIQ